MMDLQSYFTLNKDIPVPLYYQLKQQILGKILSDELKVEDYIPTEIEISNSLGISRSTVRQAINELVTEGYLFRVKGKGTYVSKPKIDEGFFQKLDSFNHEMMQKGLKPSTKVLSLKVIPAVENINKSLGIPENEKLIYLCRLRFANDEPLVYLETYLPYSKFPELISEDFTHQSLYTLLEEKYNTRITRAVRRIEAISAKSQEMKILNLSKSSAICLVKTTAFGSGDTPVEYSVARYRGDRNQFTVELVRK